MNSSVSQTHLSRYQKIYQGKVRDIYEKDGILLLVATDRISAFDYILPTPIPQKGKILTEISSFWFGETKSVIPNHLISTDVSDFVSNDDERAMLEGRSMVVRKLERLPIEAIVRAFLTGSAWAAYQKTGIVHGIRLPAGLKEGHRFETPIFTPTTKAEIGEHDAPLTFDEVVAEIGSVWAEKMREASLRIFSEASRKAEAQGLLIADTKMEFGKDGETLVLIDELLTPDSSRFWLASEFDSVRVPNPWDKQIVRDYLLKSSWDRKSPPPPLPDEIVRETLYRYRSIADRLKA